MKTLGLLFQILFLCISASQVYADCQGCCSSHGGVVCRNGVTMCADGTSLSTTCRNKGCVDCNSDPIEPPPTTPQPTTDPNNIDDDHDGYTENQGDCNDYDPLEFPGQIWYKDYDEDGYSDGTTIITCSRPANYLVVSELYQTYRDINDLVADPRLHGSPIIYQVTPTLLSPNKPLVISGDNFGTYQGSGFLSFNNNVSSANILNWSETQITCLVPLGIQPDCLTITTNLGQSNCINYDVKITTLPWLMLLLSDEGKL